MSKTFLLLLLLGTAFAATHVNISIAQHPLTSSATDVSNVDTKEASSAQLRTAPLSDKQYQSDLSYHNDGGQERSAKLQEPKKYTNFRPAHERAEQKHLSTGSHDSVFFNEGRSAKVLQFGNHDAPGSFSEKMKLGDHDQGYSKSLQHQDQPHSQFRQLPNKQDKQNQEFERYIQNYHNGPTVETVYESASPSPHRHQQSTSSFSSSTPQRVVAIGSKPTQMHKFERLVELPTDSPALLPAGDDDQTHANVAEVIKKTASSSSSSSSSTTFSSSFDGNQGAVGNDQHNFDQATIYNKPSFDQTNFANNNKPNFDQATTYSKPSTDSSNYAPNNNKPSFDQATNYNKPSFESTNYASNNNKPNFDPTTTYTKPMYEPANYAPSNDKPSFDQAPSYNKPSFDQINYAAGNDQPNFDQTTSYNKPSYDQSNYNYGGGAYQPELYNQFPPSVNAPQGGYYGGYYGNNDGSGYYGSGPTQPSGLYLPQRPVITKTIQIAQPALKAKKYEVRHPAIQKEYYDIEERVLIKPAGTIVVELDHPVSKIPRGETILPLGHVHPAVASAYNTNGQGAAQSSVGGVSSYSSSNTAEHNNQYSPSPVYNPTKPVYEENHHHHNPVISGTTIASTIASTPSNDPSSKGNLVEANLNRQFSVGELQFVDTTHRSQDQEKQNKNDLYLATDSNGNQRQISSKNLTPGMVSHDEPDFARKTPHVDVKNNGAPAASSFSNNQKSDNLLNQNANSGASASFTPSKPLFQANYNNNNNNNNHHNNGEFFAANYYNNPNHQQDFKPARLQEERDFKSAHLEKQQDFKPARLQEQQDFKSARLQEEPAHKTAMHSVESPTHVIRLPPVQHDIYLGRLEQATAERQPLQQSGQIKNTRYVDEAARILQIKPYLQQHKGPVVLYALTPMRPVHPNSQHQSQRYTQPEQSRPHFEHYRNQFRHVADDTNRVQYSAPYSNMRYHPEGSSSAHITHPNYLDNSNKKANLLLENKPDSSEEESSKEEQKNNDSNMRPQAHIQIQIPNQPDEADKPIVVSSTISPPTDHGRPEKYRLSLSSSFSSYSEPSETEKINSEQNFNRGDQESHFANLESKPDCDKSLSANYENVPLNYNHDAQGVQGHLRGPQKFMRLIEQPSSNTKDNTAPSATPATAPASSANIQTDEVDVNVKSAAGHVATPGSRVIAATAAPTGASASSESFHKRRIVVNHPFQTVREVVEHEPYTNYHQVQVNEPSMHASYYQETHYQPTHGALRQIETMGVPVYYQ